MGVPTVNLLNSNQLLPYFLPDEPPEEILIEIFKYLQAQSIKSSSRVCKQWNTLLNDNALWSLLFAKHFGASVVAEQNAKAHYQTRSRFKTNLAKGMYKVHNFSQCNTLTVSSIGKVICANIAGNPENQLQMVDLKTNERTAMKCLHQHPVSSLLVTNQAKLISGDDTGIIHILDLKTGKSEATLTGGPKEKIEELRVTKEGNLISVQRNFLTYWDLSNQTSYPIAEKHDFSFTLYDEKIIFLEDGNVKIWNSKTHQHENSFIPTQQITCMIGTGAELITGSKEGKIQIWDLKNQTLKMDLEEENGHEGPIRSLISPQKGTLISSAGDWNIKIWDLNTGRCPTTIFPNREPRHENGLIALGGEWFASLYQNDTGEVMIYNDGLVERILDHYVTRSEYLKFCNYGQLIIKRLGSSQILDFTASEEDVLAQLAESLEDDTSIRIAIQSRFKRMPKSTKNAIYAELCQILHPGCSNAEYGKIAFNKSSTTSQQKAQAIRNYLKSTQAMSQAFVPRDE